MENAHPSGAECSCEFRRSAPAHHDRLLDLERDPFDVLTELIDLAATWGEVDHEDEAIIDPSDWPAFVEHHDHAWVEPDKVLEVMISLWSTTRPCRHDLRHRGASGARVGLGSVTEIGRARSVRGDERSA